MQEPTPQLPTEASVESLRAEAEAARRRLEALDAATVAISQDLSLERVLQLIVDSVRPLVGASYAALGLPDEDGRVERFITSGIDEATRRSIGPLPRGKGLLGVIIREAKTLMIEDMAADPRAVGFPPGHPQMRSLLGVPVRDIDRIVGNLYLSDKVDGAPFDAADARLVESFARHAGLAIHNARVHEELRQLAVLQDRERIAQDLHDGTIQSLYAVGLSLEDVGETLEEDPAHATARIDAAIDAIHASIRGIREFITDLRAPGVRDIDLADGLTRLAEEFTESTFLPVDVRIDTGVGADVDDTLQLLKLAREALSNVSRHADAKSVVISLTDHGDRLRLEISDDGRGFDTSSPPVAGHLGLFNMQARAESLEGSMRIESDDDGGTRVIVEVPSVRPTADERRADQSQTEERE